MQKNNTTDNGFVTIMNDFQFMPKIMKQLAWVQFFSWFALFSMWIYTVPPLHNTFTERQTLHLRRTTRVNQVGEMFANYNLIAALRSFITAIGKIYESKIHALYCISMQGLVLYPSISY
jgi:maltose/moltooligosaccharide transporter